MSDDLRCANCGRPIRTAGNDGYGNQAYTHGNGSGWDDRACNLVATPRPVEQRRTHPKPTSETMATSPCGPSPTHSGPFGG
jgi:hypothetical protein